MLRRVLRRLDIAAQLPAGGAGRVAVIAALLAGGIVAVGLTVLIVVFLATALQH
jgi:hypothetical protein